MHSTKPVFVFSFPKSKEAEYNKNVTFNINFIRTALDRIKTCRKIQRFAPEGTLILRQSCPKSSNRSFHKKWESNSEIT